MSWSNGGPMAESIRQYLSLRESFGAVLKNARRCLDGFDRYLGAHFPDARTVTREMIQGYLATLRCPFGRRA